MERTVRPPTGDRILAGTSDGHFRRTGGRRTTRSTVTTESTSGIKVYLIGRPRRNRANKQIRWTWFYACTPNIRFCSYQAIAAPWESGMDAGRAGSGTMDRQPGLLWPWVCILLFLFLLAAISPTGWAPESAPQAGGDAHRAAQSIGRPGTSAAPRPPRTISDTPANDLPELPRQISYRVESRRAEAVKTPPPAPAIEPEHEAALAANDDSIGPSLPGVEALTFPRVASPWRPEVNADPGPALALEYDAIEIAAVPAPPTQPSLEDVPEEPQPGRWPMPHDLLARLEQLVKSPAAADWANGVTAQLKALPAADRTRSRRFWQVCCGQRMKATLWRRHAATPSWPPHGVGLGSRCPAGWRCGGRSMVSKRRWRPRTSGIPIV
jgi:hypothetical protein